ncbi:MAG: MOP flippase family protein [Candidatus Omnitrophica bacterium]|nr:MOP flippase family protein [Candidatus Omnitrophota bacterium]
MTYKSRIFSSIRWSGLLSGSSIIIEFLKYAILARLLDPKDFGLVSMVSVVIGFALAYTDVGISTALIHFQNVTKRELSSLYWMNIFCGIFIFLLIQIIVPGIAYFYNEEDIKPLIRIASFAFLIIPFGQQFRTLLKKELKFKVLSKIEFIAAFVGLCVCIVSAFLHYGPFSLILGALAKVCTDTMIILFISWKEIDLNFHFSLSEIKKYLRFGFWQLGERSLIFVSANIDYLLVGRYLGPKILGFYTLAYQLIVKPFLTINPILTQVAFPVFSRNQKDNKVLQNGYLKIIKLLAIIVFPIVICISILSPIIVPLIYGPNWEVSIIIIQILLPVGIFKALGNPSGSIILAKGRPDIGFKWNLFVLSMNFIVFSIAVRIGIVQMAYAWNILSFLYFFIIQFIIYYLINLRLNVFLSFIKVPILLNLVLGVMLYSVLQNFINQAINLSTLSLFLATIAGGYVLLLYVFEKEFINYLLIHLFKIKKV